MINNKTQEEIDSDITKSLNQLKANYEMYENTINQVKNHPKKNEKDKNKTIELLKEAQDDISREYVSYGGNVSDLDKIKKGKIKKKTNFSDLLNKLSKKDEPVLDTKFSIPTYVLDEEPVAEPKEQNTSNKTEPKNEHIFSREAFNVVNGQFDVIPLPSKGEPYKNKMATIPVGYLTARDENMITSPNLYRDNLIIDLLLSNKIQDKKIDPDTLLPGDRDAIILWLRASGYGPEFPVSAVDPDTGEEFESIVDLTSIKTKEFILKSDENGYFDFELPVSKDKIKFKFLNNKEEKKLKLLNELEDKQTKKAQLLNIIERLDNFIDGSDLTQATKKQLTQANTTFEEWVSTIDDEESLIYTNVVTNRLEMSIVSINGNNNREYISDYITNMNVRDSLELRKYITNNEPGLNYNVTIERPESLGGGSVPIFLKLDETLFLNVS